jgi:hypothetical protein
MESFGQNKFLRVIGIYKSYLGRSLLSWHSYRNHATIMSSFKYCPSGFVETSEVRNGRCQKLREETIDLAFQHVPEQMDYALYHLNLNLRHLILPKLRGLQNRREGVQSTKFYSALDKFTVTWSFPMSNATGTGESQK